MVDTITTDRLQELGAQPSQNTARIANQTLSDLNNVLKTVDGILGKFGTSLPELIKKRSESKPTANPNDNQFNQFPKAVQDQLMNSNGQAPMKENIVIPHQAEKKIVINADEATKDLMARIMKIEDDITGEKIKRDLRDLAETGVLQTLVENWIRGQVKLE